MVYNFVGEEVELTEGQELFIKIHNQFSACVASIDEEFWKLYERYDSLLLTVHSANDDAYKIIKSKASMAIDLLQSYDVYDIDIDSFMQEYVKDSDIDEPWRNAYGIIKSQYDAIKAANYDEHLYREQRKAARGRWVGGGFSVGSALKARAKAGALNAASGLMHSMVNSIGNRASDRRADERQDAVYADADTYYSLYEGLALTVERLSYATAFALRKYANVEVEWCSGDEQTRVESILNNLKAKKIPSDKIAGQLAKAWRMNPLNDEIYEIVCQLGMDELGDTKKTMEYFGKNVEEVRADNRRKQIDKINESIVKPDALYISVKFKTFKELDDYIDGLINMFSDIGMDVETARKENKQFNDFLVAADTAKRDAIERKILASICNECNRILNLDCKVEDEKRDTELHMFLYPSAKSLYKHTINAINEIEKIKRNRLGGLHDLLQQKCEEYSCNMDKLKREYPYVYECGCYLKGEEGGDAILDEKMFLYSSFACDVEEFDTLFSECKRATENMKGAEEVFNRVIVLRDLGDIKKIVKNAEQIIGETLTKEYPFFAFGSNLDDFTGVYYLFTLNFIYIVCNETSEFYAYDYHKFIDLAVAGIQKTRMWVEISTSDKECAKKSGKWDDYNEQDNEYCICELECGLNGNKVIREVFDRVASFIRRESEANFFEERIKETDARSGMRKKVLDQYEEQIKDFNLKNEEQLKEIINQINSIQLFTEDKRAYVGYIQEILRKPILANFEEMVKNLDTKSEEQLSEIISEIETEDCLEEDKEKYINRVREALEKRILASYEEVVKNLGTKSEEQLQEIIKEIKATDCSKEDKKKLVGKVHEELDNRKLAYLDDMVKGLDSKNEVQLQEVVNEISNVKLAYSKKQHYIEKVQDCIYSKRIERIQELTEGTEKESDERLQEIITEISVIDCKESDKKPYIDLVKAELRKRAYAKLDTICTGYENSNYDECKKLLAAVREYPSEYTGDYEEKIAARMIECEKTIWNDKCAELDNMGKEQIKALIVELDSASLSVKEVFSERLTNGLNSAYAKEITLICKGAENLNFLEIDEKVKAIEKHEAPANIKKTECDAMISLVKKKYYSAFSEACEFIEAQYRSQIGVDANFVAGKAWALEVKAQSEILNKSSAYSYWEFPVIIHHADKLLSNVGYVITPERIYLSGSPVKSYNLCDVRGITVTKKLIGYQMCLVLQSGETEVISHKHGKNIEVIASFINIAINALVSAHNNIQTNYVAGRRTQAKQFMFSTRPIDAGKVKTIVPMSKQVNITEGQKQSKYGGRILKSFILESADSDRMEIIKLLQTRLEIDLSDAMKIVDAIPCVIGEPQGLIGDDLVNLFIGLMAHNCCIDPDKMEYYD